MLKGTGLAMQGLHRKRRVGEHLKRPLVTGSLRGKRSNTVGSAVEGHGVGGAAVASRRVRQEVEDMHAAVRL